MTPPVVRQPVVVGTRGSKLARAQTQWVVDTLRAAHPGLAVETRIITTTGDRQQEKPLPEIGAKGLFTDELEKALREGSIDLAVHSAKDVPTELGEGLDILAYPVREDARDAWISRDGTAFDRLPPDSVVGTTSLRRQAQLLMRRSDIRFVGLRGNVDTRINKVHRGDCAGAVLAMAGLKRCGLAEHAAHPFELDWMIPAPGQGALALEGRRDDARIANLLSAIHDADTALAVRCEREILGRLGGGCQAPIAVYARVDDGRLHCVTLVADPPGRRTARAKADAAVDDVDAVVARIVADLRSGGADDIIAACSCG